jgi:hypothetical protein
MQASVALRRGRSCACTRARAYSTFVDSVVSAKHVRNDHGYKRAIAEDCWRARDHCAATTMHVVVVVSGKREIIIVMHTP